MTTFWTLFFIALYFLPAMEAKRRKNPKTPAILVLNVLLGWTFIGWAIAMVWAYASERN